MSDMWCAICGLLATACRCAKLERCADCNGVIVEGDCVFCREDRGEEDEDDFDDCDDPDCDICN